MVCNKQKEKATMKKKSMISFLAVVVSLCLFAGCESSSSSKGDGDSGSYAGVWTGTVCGRSLTMNISQNGTALHGSYTLSDPVFTENMSGTVSSESPSASASLKGGADRHFEITFKSYTSLSGGYFKGDTQICPVSARK